ncbi:MAG: ROK family protein [Acidobacteriia bacterium]|nr:ROK family protein [Terriglobia bacterium]
MRSLEESLFWEIFYRHQAVRSELARLFDVSAATMSRSTAVLLAKHLVVESGGTSSSRGRRPALLQVNPALAYVAGIEIDRDRVTAVITDMTGNLLGRSGVAATASNPVRKTLKDCREAVRAAFADAGRVPGQLARIGVGHTGMLDVENGLCLDWEGAPHWRRVNLRGALRETFDMEITLDDRARAVALAQHLLWPEYRRHRSAIYVQIGTGIGAGIFVNGRMVRGATLAGGEIGHIVIDRNGPLCACGKRGCVEAFASLGATIARVRQALEKGAKTSLRTQVKSPSQLTVEMIVSAARQGDPLAATALSEAGDALGFGVANAVQLLNPSLVVLAGKFANAASDFLLEAVTRAIHSQCFETMSRGLEVRVAPFRKDAGPVGCALLASLDVGAALVQKALFVPPS